MTNYLIRIFLFVFCGLLSFSLVAQTEDAEEPTYYGGSAGKKLDWAMFYLMNHYVDSTHNDRLAEVAIRSILKQLDPFSRYQSREELDKQRKQDDGIAEEGVGIKIYPLETKAMIIDVVIGGAAEKAGLKT